jgi:hypothetical protein
MLANKAAGKANWFHPGSLCSDKRYAHNSACMRAVQSARGMLACAWHIATGGRQAEAFRCRGTDTCVEGICEDSEPPVWCLGLAGADVLGAFQQAEGTGFGMINWHAKVRYNLLHPAARNSGGQQCPHANHDNHSKKGRPLSRWWATTPAPEAAGKMRGYAPMARQRVPQQTTWQWDQGRHGTLGDHCIQLLHHKQHNTRMPATGPLLAACAGCDRCIASILGLSHAMPCHAQTAVAVDPRLYSRAQHFVDNPPRALLRQVAQDGWLEPTCLSFHSNMP